MRQLDTPYMRLDLDIMRSNIAAMTDHCQAYGVEWRPHAKCHKSPEIGQQLIDAGAIGLTCAKLGEAEVFAQAGIRDLLIANLLVGETKCERLAQLTRAADPIVVFDNLAQAIPLQEALARSGQTVRALIEVDIGLQRVGTPPGAETVALAKEIDQLSQVSLVGLMAYEGHLLTVKDPVEKRTQIHSALDRLQAARDTCRQSGFPCDIISCGGTGSFEHTLAHPVVTELQAGGAIFMDAFYRYQCQVESLDFALTIVTTVVSTPDSGRAVFDAGRKTLNIEIETPRVLGRPDLTVTRLSAEHGELTLGPGSAPLNVGDQLRLIPGYADLTTNLHDEFQGFEQDQFTRSIPLLARGKVQ